MRGPLGPDNQYNPPASRIFNPSGRFDTLATPAGNPLDPPDTWYTVGGLQAYTTYEFQVYSQNDVSKAASPWVKGRTLEARMFCSPCFYRFFFCRLAIVN